MSLESPIPRDRVKEITDMPDRLTLCLWARARAPLSGPEAQAFVQRYIYLADMEAR